MSFGEPEFQMLNGHIQEILPDRETALVFIEELGGRYVCGLCRLCHSVKCIMYKE